MYWKVLSAETTKESEEGKKSEIKLIKLGKFEVKNP